MTESSHQTIWEAESILVREQVRLKSGSLATSSDVNAISVRVFLVGATREETVAVYSDTPVVASTVIAASTAGWTRDATGYNIDYTIDATAFTKYGGNVYAVEMILDTVLDGPIAVVSYVAVRGVMSSADGVTSLDELVSVIIQDKVNSIERGAQRNRPNPIKLWSIKPQDEVTRPPFTLTTSFKTIAWGYLRTPWLRDSGWLQIRAMLEHTLVAAPSTSNFIPVLRLEAAPDFTGQYSVTAADRGKCPTALGSWVTVADLTLARIDSGAGHTDHTWIDWTFDQIAAGSFAHKARIVSQDPTTAAAPITPYEIPGTCSLDVTQHLRLRLRAKTAGSISTVKLTGTDALVHNPRESE